MLQTLLNLLELPEDDTVPDDEHFIEVEDTPGYQTAYSQLAFASKKERDPFAETVPNVRTHLAISLQKLSASHPGKVRRRVLLEVRLFSYTLKASLIIQIVLTLFYMQ